MHGPVDRLLLSRDCVEEMRCARRGRDRARRIFALLGLCAAGCLPAGDAPLGQHFLAGRTIAAVFFTASEVQGLPSNILVLGPARPAATPGTSTADLYALPYAPLAETAQGWSDLPPTLTGVILGNDVEPAAYIPRTDSRGRLIFVTAAEGTPDAEPRVARFDFATGQQQDLAPALAGNPGFLLSASRGRLFAGTSVFELDGTSDLGTPRVITPAFVGDDLYYVSGLTSGALAGGSSISRSRAGVAPQTLLSASGTVKLMPFASDLGPQLLVSSATDAGDIPYLVFSTTLSLSTSIPSQIGWAQFQSTSSDGHWLLFRASLGGDYRLLAFDWTTNYDASLSSGGRAIDADSEWRPGRHQLWSGLSPTGVAVWNPETAYLQQDLERTPRQVRFSPDGRTSMFTRDGNHWLSIEYATVGNVVESTIFLGPADDTQAPRQQLSTQGQELYALWETDEGLLLVGVGSFGENRQDIYLVDPLAGTSRGIASGGRLLALGHGRVLALLSWQTSTSTGDLTLVDLETGAKTVLAQDVYDVAIDPGISPGTSADQDPSADRLAPGTAIAFLVRNRLDSPYDGLWVGQLP